jgi:DNA-binding LytR/AlgR family response regulator
MRRAPRRLCRLAQAAERFTLAAYKAMEEQQKRLALAQVQEPKAPEEPDTLDYFFVNVAYALVKIRIPDISHVEGMKDYVKIYLSTADKPILTKSTLKAIEDKLPTQRFLRVHKSFIVNLDQIEVFRSQKVWIGPHAIPVSETYLDALMEVLNK